LQGDLNRCKPTRIQCPPLRRESESPADKFSRPQLEESWTRFGSQRAIISCRAPMASSLSQPERIRLRHPRHLLAAQGDDGVGFVEPAVLVELPGEHGLEVVALELGLRAVDDPDRAFEARALELVPY